LLAKADELSKRFRERARPRATTLKLSAIGTAAAGLVPLLLDEFRERRPDVAVQLLEAKTTRRLSGRLDLALMRAPEHSDTRLEFLALFHKTAVVAVPARHKLAGRKRLSIRLRSDQPSIVPDRRLRSHSHDLIIKLFPKPDCARRLRKLLEKQRIVILAAAKSRSSDRFSLGLAVGRTILLIWK